MACKFSLYDFPSIARLFSFRKKSINPAIGTAALGNMPCMNYKFFISGFFVSVI